MSNDQPNKWLSKVGGWSTGNYLLYSLERRVMNIQVSKCKSWLRLLAATGGPLLPPILYFICPPLSIPAFTPRQVIYENNLISFLFALWSAPTFLSAFLSRTLQVGLLWVLDPPILQCYGMWIFVAILRTSVGHLLTRSVGWAAPKFYSHWALYESYGGYGPALVGLMYLSGGVELIRTILGAKASRNRDLVFLVLLSAVLCWLDDAPWTYGLSILGASSIPLGRAMYRAILKTTAPHPMLPDGTPKSTMLSVRPRTIVTSAFLAVAVVWIPYLLYDRFKPYTSISIPRSPSPQKPLLEILVLSSPRPDVGVATAIINTTLTSYLPYLSLTTVMSVFTHSASHAAFKATKEAFKNTDITFFEDIDAHPGSASSQYLHLAEAFRWVTEKPVKAEWVMLVEDDFPICGGEKGWNAVRQVMQILESSRMQGSPNLMKQGGFVATGGSGLIIHHTTLPILSLLLHTYAETASKLPPNAPRRPADVIMQDCLLGTDPLCPQLAQGGGLVITSRLVMDHIGGMATTNPHKAPNSDKWRCGWRHPFHGRPQVEVVVV